MAPGKKTGGRATGTPNKATGAAREAIALFVDANAPKLQEWLESVAKGVHEPSDDPDKPGKMLVPPNPAKAFELFQSVVEYHIPKLARTELTGKDGEALQTVVKHVYEDAATAPKREEA